MYWYLVLSYQTQNFMLDQENSVQQGINEHLKKVAEANHQPFKPLGGVDESVPEQAGGEQAPESIENEDEKIIDKKIEGVQGVEEAALGGVKDGPDAESVMAFLKKEGVQVDSLEDLKKKFIPDTENQEPSPEESAIRKMDIDKWAITNKKVSADLLEAYKTDSELSKIEIAYKVYSKDRANDIDDATGEPYTDEALRAEFESENYLYSEDTDQMKKRAIRKLELIADVYMNEKYSPLIGVESEYEAEQQSTTRQATLNTLVDSAKQGIIKDGMKFSLTDGDETIDVNVPISKKALDEISFLQNSFGEAFDLDDVKAKVLEQYALKNMIKIVHEASTSYHSKKLLEMKARGVGIEQAIVSKDKTDNGVSPEMKAELERIAQNQNKKRNN